MGVSSLGHGSILEIRWIAASGLEGSLCLNWRSTVKSSESRLSDGENDEST